MAGKVAPGAAGKPVSLQRNVAGAWQTIATRNLSADSTYRFSVKPGKKATWKLRVVKAAAGKLKRGASPVRTLRAVTGAYAVTATLPTAAVPSGTAVTVVGRVTPAAPRTTVSVQRRSSGRWTTVGRATLSASSGYRYTTDAPAPGSHSYRVIKPYSATTAAGKSPTRVLTVAAATPTTVPSSSATLGSPGAAPTPSASGTRTATPTGTPTGTLTDPGPVPRTDRVNLSSVGAQGNGDTGQSVLSGDGRFLAFSSTASNLVPDDTNGKSDVFVRDLAARTTTRVSVSPAGTQGNLNSYQPAISTDGRYVAFATDATNLAAGDTNNARDVYVRDTRAGTTARVSVASDGTAGDATSEAPDISGDGRLVVFESDATNLVSGDSNGVGDVFLRNVVSGTTTRAVVGVGGAEPDFRSYSPAISADGDSVAFSSGAQNLVGGDDNQQIDVFVRRLSSGVTSLVSVSSSGTQATQDSDKADLSADGRYVAFHSEATNLIDGQPDNDVPDGPQGTDAFLRDTQTGTTSRINTSSTGAQDNGWVYSVAMSEDARYIAFRSTGANLVSGHANDVFVKDTETGATTVASVSTAGAPGNGWCENATISRDGRVVGFISDSDNLVGGDTNGLADSFVRTRWAR